jgi:hypothetical protein
VIDLYINKFIIKKKREGKKMRVPMFRGFESAGGFWRFFWLTKDASRRSLSSSLPPPVHFKNPGTLELWNAEQKSCFKSILCCVPVKRDFRSIAR